MSNTIIIVALIQQFFFESLTKFRNFDEPIFLTNETVKFAKLNTYQLVPTIVLKHSVDTQFRSRAFYEISWN